MIQARHVERPAEQPFDITPSPSTDGVLAKAHIAAPVGDESGDPARPGRILFVGAYVPTAQGSRGVSEDLALRLATKGWSITLTSRQSRRVLRVLDMVRASWTGRGAYDIAVIDVYSGSAFRWAEFVAWTLRRAHKPYVLALHGGNLPALVRSNPERVRRLLESAAAVAAPSEFLARAFAALRSDVSVIPNGIELGAFEWRERRPVQPLLLWLRAFHGMYNPVLAVETLQRLKQEFGGIQLRMIGADKDGSLEVVRAAADRLGMSSQLELVGGVAKDEVPRHVDAADIFLNTTDIDNTPVSVLEAMAAGMCVVSTNVGGIPYLLEDGYNALLVPPRDPERMAAAVRRVLTEPELAARLSRNARTTATRFSWETVLPLWSELLYRVTEDSRRG